jgi:hypothetical protein
LTFAIPFIFLFIFFFIRGLEKENKTYLLLSFLIMLLLVPLHVTSVTFALPILLFSGALYYKYIKKEFRFFLIFLLIPLVGLIFYSFVKNVIIMDSLEVLIKELQFRRELSLAEALDDSLTTTYSMAGGILAGIGLLAVLWGKRKELYPYIFWALYLLLMILIFRMTDISYLSPYHRNFYYLTVSLPLLSAFGLNWIINFIASWFKRINFNFVAIPIVIIAIFFSFISHDKIIQEELPYLNIITVSDYKDLTFLARLPRGKVMTLPILSLAVPAIARHKAVGEFSDKFGWQHAYEFFNEDDCRFKDALIMTYNINYIISQHEISCGYKLLRDEYNYIYEVNP